MLTHLVAICAGTHRLKVSGHFRGGTRLHHAQQHHMRRKPGKQTFRAGLSSMGYRTLQIPIAVEMRGRLDECTMHSSVSRGKLHILSVTKTVVICFFYSENDKKNGGTLNYFF